MIALPLAPLTVVFLVAGALLLGVAILTLRVGTETAVREWFVALLVADTIWAISSGVPLEAATPVVAFYGEAVRLTASSVAALTWFSFAVVYTGREELLSRGRLAVLATPFVVHILAFTTNSVHGLSVTDLQITIGAVQTVVSYEFGPVYLLSTVYALALVVGGSLAVIDAAIRDRQLYADQSVALLVGSLMPIAGSVVTVFGVIDVGATNLTPATLGVTAVTYGYALFRADLLTTGPLIVSAGREIAVESLDEGFLIADGNGQVVDANPAARDLLDEPTLEGQSVERALPGEAALPETGRRTLDTPEGRVLEAQVMPATGEETTVGRVLTLRDVTERRRRRERVEVLNRVLRHNLRNDLNVIEGFGQQLLADERGETVGSFDTERAAERIVERSQQLMTVAEHARTLEELLDADAEPERERVALPALLAETVADTAKASDRPVDCRTDLPESGVVRSNESVLRLVIEELVDNAVRHNDDPEPTVWVAATIGETIEVQIADDGPGIPERERRPVLEGNETPLEHGSRLGLWMVRWGVRYLGGELAIEDRSPTGTVVTVRLPNDRESIGGDFGVGPADGPTQDGGVGTSRRDGDSGADDGSDTANIGQPEADGGETAAVESEVDGGETTAVGSEVDGDETATGPDDE